MPRVPPAMLARHGGCRLFLLPSFLSPLRSTNLSRSLTLSLQSSKPPTTRKNRIFSGVQSLCHVSTAPFSVSCHVASGESSDTPHPWTLARVTARGRTRARLPPSAVTHNGTEADIEHAESERERSAELEKAKVWEGGDGSEVVQRRKKKVALWLAYVGTAYRGLQIQGGSVSQGLPTVEEVVQRGILEAGGMLPSNYGNLGKVGWTRSSRTDKGVHSMATVVSLHLEVPLNAWEAKFDGSDLADEINAHLPSDIRIFSVLPVSRSFSARKFCKNRSYHYLLPVGVLGLEGNNSENNVDLTLNKFRDLLKKFEGKHAFHNYTVRRLYRPSAPGELPAWKKKKKKQKFKSEVDTFQVRGVGGGDKGGGLDEGKMIRSSNLLKDTKGERDGKNDDSMDDAGEGVERVRRVRRGVASGEGGVEVGTESEVKAIKKWRQVALELASSAEKVEGGREREVEEGEMEFTSEVDGKWRGYVSDGEDEDDESIIELTEASSEGERQGEGRRERERDERTAWWIHEPQKDDRIGSSHFRIMEECTCGEVEEVGGVKFVRVVIKGESFMLHQIRKMVGTAVAVMRGQLSEDLIPVSLSRHCRMVLPLAPSEGLVLYDNEFFPFRAPTQAQKKFVEEKFIEKSFTGEKEEKEEDEDDERKERLEYEESRIVRLSKSGKRRADEFWVDFVLPSMLPFSKDEEYPWNEWLQHLHFKPIVTEMEGSSVLLAWEERRRQVLERKAVSPSEVE